MKKLRELIVVGLFIHFFSANAQRYDSSAWIYSKTITSNDLREHLSIIASDEYEGRETGKRGQKMAMKYLIDQFKSYGIKDYNNHSYIQSFPLIEQENKGVTLQIEGETFEMNKDFIISPSIIDKKTIEGELVFAGYGIEEEKYNSYRELEVENNGVFLWQGTPKKEKLAKEWNYKKKIELLEKKGALATFSYNENLKALIDKFGHYYKKPKTALVEREKKPSVLTITLTKGATERILKKGKIGLQRLEKKGVKKKMKFSLPYKLEINKPSKELSGENVLAFIPGTEKKDEILVLTAHYDHIGKTDSLIFNGADDDGTGTVSLLEIAEAFQLAVKDGLKPKRSILIMPVSGEEKGLLGSKYYSQNPVFPLEKTVANLNVDMIGRYDEAHKSDSNYIYLIGSDRLSQDLHDMSEWVNKTYTKIGLDYTFNAEDDPNRFYYRSDHYNFAKNNIPVIFYFSGVHEDYHKSTDTVDKIDYQKTERVARLIFLTAWHIANAEDRLQLKEELK